MAPRKPARLCAIPHNLFVAHLYDSIELHLGVGAPKTASAPHLRRIYGAGDAVEDARQRAASELVLGVARHHGVDVGDQLLVADAVRLQSRGIDALRSDVHFVCF